MRIRSLLAALAILPALVLSLAAHPGVSDDSTCRPYDEADEESPVLCEIDTFFQCPANDAEKVRHPALQALVPLTYDAPTRSVTEGAGCGHLDEPVFGSTSMSSFYEFNAAGFTDGAIDSATFDVWVLGPGVGQIGESVELDVRLVIDGESVFGTEDTVDVTGAPVSFPARKRVVAEVIPSSTQASVLLRFTATGIGDYLAGATLSDEERYVELTVNYPHTGDCTVPPNGGSERCAPAGLYPFAWGSTEVPGGLSYNRLADLGTIVPAGEGSAG